MVIWVSPARRHYIISKNVRMRLVKQLIVKIICVSFINLKAGLTIISRFRLFFKPYRYMIHSLLIKKIKPQKNI